MSHICLFRNMSKFCRVPYSIKSVTRSMTYCSSKHLAGNSSSNENRLHFHGALTVYSPSLSSIRTFSSQSDADENDKICAVYHELYLFEKITFIRVLGRFAKYSCLSFVVGAPLCVLLNLSSVMGFEAAQTMVANLGFYAVLFTSQSFIFSSRILGKMMISDDDERMIKLSHLSLFGNRKDVFIKPSDIAPLQDISTALTKKMIFITLRNSKRFIFFPEMGTYNTNFEVIELALSGGLKDKK